MSANPPSPPPDKKQKCSGDDEASARRVETVAGHVAAGATANAAGGTPPRAADDFYLHVNKSWLDHPDNAIPDEYSQWGGFTKLHDEGLKKQIAMVKELKSKADPTEEERKPVEILQRTFLD